MELGKLTSDIILPKTPFDLNQYLILLGRRGSEAHGLYLPPGEAMATDDRDLIGVCIPPMQYYYGLTKWTHGKSFEHGWDVILYDIQKIVFLLCKQNPNVLSLLWLHPDDWLYITWEGQSLIDNRLLFRDKDAAFKAFHGYAVRQRHLMTRGQVYSGYMGAKRKALVDQFGYDTKNASHLIRLLYMGGEYLRTGEMQVRREWDRETLLSIKRGEWSQEQVLRLASDYEEILREAHRDSPLPDIDVEAVNRYLVNLMQRSVRYEPLPTRRAP